MPTHTERLFELLKSRSFVRGEVILASGEKSDYYFDGRMVAVHPEGAFVIGEVIYELIRDLNVDAVGGLAVGAVPLVTSTVISCFNHGLRMEGFWVREEAKSHGTRKHVEGKLPDSARVVILEDVVTSGSSVMKAIRAVEEKGATVIRIVALVDRERGARQLFSEHGYDYQPIFSKEEFFANEHA